MVGIDSFRDSSVSSAYVSPSSNHYHVIIGGSGPSGLAAAREIKRVLPNARVAVVDKERYCSGGLMNDCKLNLTPKIGMEPEFLGITEEEAWPIIMDMDAWFVKHGADPKLHGTDNEKLRKLEEKVRAQDATLVSCQQRHVGTDRAKALIRSMRRELEAQGVEFLLGTEIKNVEVNGVQTVHTSKGSYTCNNLVLAFGRGGSQWLRKLADKIGIQHQFGPIDIGFRIELPFRTLEETTNAMYDPKIRTYGSEDPWDYTKTFCTNPGGRIRLEAETDSIAFEGEKLQLINGDAKSEDKTSNTNFAFLQKIRLTRPLSDTKMYAEQIVIQAYLLGGMKPLIQRMGDFMRGVRSKHETFFSRELGYDVVRPSLQIGKKEGGGVITPGDIRLALPGRIVSGLERGLQVLNRIVGVRVAEVPIVGPDGEYIVVGEDADGKEIYKTREERLSVLHPSTLICAPEVKFGDSVYVNKGHLESTVPGIYVVGNANNTSGIVAAWVSGVVAAQGILAKRGALNEPIVVSARAEDVQPEAQVVVPKEEHKAA